MSETPPGTPQTPAGWYPTPQGERWWDGNAWSDHFRNPPQQAQPPGQQPGQQTQPGYAQPQQGYQQPQGYYQPQPGYPAAPYGAVPAAAPSHLARNLLIAFAVLFILLVGGCTAIVALTGKAVNDAVEDATANDNSPGGASNPLEISPGQPFDVRGFSYAAGWTVTQDPDLQLIEVTGLKVTNNRDSGDRAFVTISFLSGSEVLATSDCTSDGNVIAVGTTVELSCFSGEPLPAYDTVTIQDVF